MVKPDFAPTGLRTYYYSDGVTKRYEGRFVNGVKQGDFKYWTSTGELRAVVTYIDGIVTGSPKLFDVGSSHLSSVYEFDLGILKSSVHYNNSNTIATFNYEDKNRYNDPELPAPPPVGTMWHAETSIENPAEMFRGTVWSYIKNSFYIDDDGVTRNMTVWVREPDSAGGGSNYGPFLLMNEFTEMREDGSTLNNGQYERLITNDVSTSVVDGNEVLWDHDTGMIIWKSHWDMGKQTQVELLQLSAKNIMDQRTWQDVKIANDKATTGWVAAYDIQQNIHSVLTPTFNYTFDSNTQVASVVQYKEDILG